MCSKVHAKKIPTHTFGKQTGKSLGTWKWSRELDHPSRQSGLSVKGMLKLLQNDIFVNVHYALGVFNEHVLRKIEKQKI